MNGREGHAREVALPASALSTLRRALKREAGPLAAIHALHAAGYGAGETLFDSFARTVRQPLEEVGETTFWTGLTRFMGRRGWGSLDHRSLHPGVGLLTSSDWAEAGDGSESQPGCAFSAGLLSHVLTRAAGEPVAVLEVSCRGRGDESCAFAFGSEATIHDLYGLLLDGKRLEQALAEL